VLANANFKAAYDGYNDCIRNLPSQGLATIWVDDASVLPDPYDLDVMQSGSLHANFTGTTREALSYNDAIWGQGNRNGTPVDQMNARTNYTGTFNWRCNNYNLNSATTSSNSTTCGWGTAPLATGNGLTIFGARSLPLLTSANLVTTYGDLVAPLATTPSALTAIGEAAFPNLTTGTFNTAVGNGAGGTCTTCTESGAFGHNALLGPAVSNSYQIGAGTNSTSNTLQFKTFTVIDANGDSPRPVNGPATAPSGACTVAGEWVFSQDGHATFCNAGTWTTKI
jgi:hypothetical protein